MTNLVQFDTAYRAIMVAKNIDEVKQIRDKMEALRLYLKQQGESLEMQNACAEIKLRAERKAGELLKEMPRSSGGRPKKNSFHDETSFEKIIDEEGLSKASAYRLQAIADIPEEIFEQVISETKSTQEELTTKGLLSTAKKKIPRRHTPSLPPDGANGIRLPEPKPILEQAISHIDGCRVIFGDARHMDLTQFERYGVIVADPPWPYRVTIKQGTTEGQYETMTDEDLKGIPVPELALPDSVLLLWGTWPKLPEALALMEAWGFGYVTGFPWVKTTSGNNIDYGVGYWIRGVSEYVLIGRRGDVSIEPLRKKGFMGLLAENDNGGPGLWLGGPNLQHSRKPDSVHQIAEYLPGPYLELFARRSRHGWTVFGNEQTLLQKTLA